MTRYADLRQRPNTPPHMNTSPHAHAMRCVSWPRPSDLGDLWPENVLGHSSSESHRDDDDYDLSHNGILVASRCRLPFSSSTFNHPVTPVVMPWISSTSTNSLIHDRDDHSVAPGNVTDEEEARRGLVSGKKYSFLAEWNDASTYTVRNFILNFFTRDSTVEMIDLKTRRVFLRRTECESCGLRDLYAGNVVAILSRHLRIVGYADSQTAAFLGPKHERAVLVVKPVGVRRLGDVWAAIEATDATVCKALMLRLTPQDAKLLSADSQEPVDLSVLDCPAVCIQLLGERVLARLRSQPVARKDGDVGQVEGTLQSLCWISKDQCSAEKESAVLFGGQFERRCNTAVFENTTCCVIKPHVFKDGNISRVLRKIMSSGFEVIALQMFHLDCAKAEEFLLVYKGVVPNYTNMVQQMCSGPCLAMEVKGPDPANTALDFKQLVGPADPVLARKLYPNSLRALVGRDLHRNAVHCTDVPEDCRIELEFFFHSGKT